MMRRQLERSGIEVSAMGLGCWASGGLFFMDGKADSYGDVDDAESARAIQRAIDLGITFFDTSDAYGTGHGEEVLGKAVRGQRDDVVLATKFGYTHDADRRELTGTDTSADYIRRACEASLQRLQTDYIDLYQLHVWSIAQGQRDEVFSTLDDLRDAGQIRAYGWSTGEIDNARFLATRTNATSILHPSMCSTMNRNCWRSVQSTIWQTSAAGRSRWACCPASSTRHRYCLPTTCAEADTTGSNTSPRVGRARNP